jgi:hypothetical protein
VNSAHIVGLGAEAWKLNQQTYNSVEFIKKSTCELWATFLPIEARCFKKIKLRASM